MFNLTELERAQQIVHAAMPPTAAHAWPLLSERLGANVIVKHENHTPTGAFKVRGGLVYVDRLKRERPDVAAREVRAGNEQVAGNQRYDKRRGDCQVESGVARGQHESDHEWRRGIERQ